MIKKIVVHKKMFVISIVLFFIVVLGITKNWSHVFYKNNDTTDNYVLKEPKYTFFPYGIVHKKTGIYSYVNKKYRMVGDLEEGVQLEFLKITNDYFLVKGFDEKYYVKVEDIRKEDSITYQDNRYKNYILFNENIVTGDKTSFYDDDNHLLYTIDSSFDFPIIIKDSDRYGIEYNNRLLFIQKDNVKEVKDSHNTDKKNASGVGVLNYHFFYDDSNSKEKNDCNQEICESTTQFQSELDYLKENNIFPITTKELEWYIDGKIHLPKSVLITIDDGGRTQGAVDLLKKYKYYATIFLVTSWYDPSNYYKSEYIELHSHTDNMHNQGDCPTGQGGGIQCLARDKILNDLKISRDKLGGSTVIAYPFYEYNDYSIELLKEAGFILAFVGENTYSDNLVHVGSDKYKLPRFVMVNYTTKKDLDRYFGNIN